MPNDIQEITPKAAVPDWVTETPEPEEPWPAYTLMVQEPNEGTQLQNVEMTRAEFLNLKKHLAKMRGFDVPEAEPETAPAESKPEAAGATDGAAAKSTSSRLVARMIDAITDELRSSAEVLYSKPADDSKERSRQLTRNEFQGDVLLLQQIVTDAISGGFAHEFPHESPLVGAVRGNLDL